MEPVDLPVRDPAQLAVDPLNTAGTNNDNLFFTGTPGTVFVPSSGLGVPDFTQLGNAFANQR